MMLEAELVPETLEFKQKLTRLAAQEDFIEFSRREIFKSYTSAFTWQREPLDVLFNPY
jgi:hypothetical protein